MIYRLPLFMTLFLEQFPFFMLAHFLPPLLDYASHTFSLVSRPGKNSAAAFAGPLKSKT